MTIQNTNDEAWETAPTGFYIGAEGVHVFVQELSDEINKYIAKNNIKSVYDLGCGDGAYLHGIKKAYPDVSVLGFEGHPSNDALVEVVQQDLSIPIDLASVDMVMSIEVGEHIPQEYEQIFLDNITRPATNHLLVSWAIEGQIGSHHVNCRNNDYIIQEITKRGWIYNEKISKHMKSKMPKGNWLENTIMLFTKSN